MSSSYQIADKNAVSTRPPQPATMSCAQPPRGQVVHGERDRGNESGDPAVSEKLVQALDAIAAKRRLLHDRGPRHQKEPVPERCWEEPVHGREIHVQPDAWKDGARLP